jgi:hypothetical protein
MVFAIKSSLMPSPKRGFHWEVEKAVARVSLETYTPNNLSVISAELVL